MWVNSAIFTSLFEGERNEKAYAINSNWVSFGFSNPGFSIFV
jgi:hypothetical protein